jgi:Ca2+-binding EF-hand superfamily protein
MNNQLSPLELKNLDDVIQIYGSKPNQTIPTMMLGPALRAMGLNPLEKEVIGYVTEFDKAGFGFLTKHQLEIIYLRKKQDPDTLDQLLNAFKFLDKDGSGLIGVQEFKYYMSKMGENIPETDLDDILKTAEIDLSSKINLEKFAKTLFGLKP